MCSIFLSFFLVSIKICIVPILYADYKKKSDRNADESIKTNVLYVSSYTVSTYI